MASRGYQEQAWDDTTSLNHGASRAADAEPTQPITQVHASRSAEPVPPPVQKPVVFTPPSSNVAALLRSRASKENPATGPVPPPPVAQPFVDSELPPEAEPPRASRAAVSDEASSNVTALLRSQAAVTGAITPVAASRGEVQDYDYPAEEPDEYTAVLAEDEDGYGDDGGNNNAKPPVKRNRRVSDILLLVLAILLIAGGAIYGIVATMQSNSQQTKVDMVGNHVEPDDPSMFDPQTIEAMDANDDTGQRFIIDAVNLDVPLGEVNEVNNVINPPGFKAAYQIRNRGVSLDKAETGTVYVAAHSLRSPGKAPGNYIISIDAGTVIVPVGSTIQVGSRTYIMKSSQIVAKTDLGADSKIWANTPGMLVFITCLQYNDASKYKNTNGHSPTNAVIIGQLVS